MSLQHWHPGKSSRYKKLERMAICRAIEGWVTTLRIQMASDTIVLMMTLHRQTLDKQWVVQTPRTPIICSNKLSASSRRSRQVWVTTPITICIGDNKSISHLDLPIQITRPTSFHRGRQALAMRGHSGWKGTISAGLVQAKPSTRAHPSPTHQTPQYQWGLSTKWRTHHTWSHSDLSTEKWLT